MVKRNTIAEIEYRIGENVAEGLRKRLNFTVVAKGRESSRKIEVKRVGKGIEIEDSQILDELDGLGDVYEDIGKQLTLTLEDKIAGDKVLAYEVKVESERDVLRRVTLVYVEVEYTVLEEDKESLEYLEDMYLVIDGKEVKFVDGKEVKFVDVELIQKLEKVPKEFTRVSETEYLGEDGYRLFTNISSEELVKKVRQKLDERL